MECAHHSTKHSCLQVTVDIPVSDPLQATITASSLSYSSSSMSSSSCQQQQQQQ